MAAFGEAYVVDPFGNQQASVAVDLIDPATGARIADTVYRDAALGQIATLPLTTDTNGHAPFWLAAGKTVIGRVVLGGSTYDDYINVVDPTAPVSGGGSVPTHTHVEADVNPLVADLAGKAPVSHTHAESAVTNLVNDLAGKALAAHTHLESDVGNLTADLTATEKTVNKGNANGYLGLDNTNHALAAFLGTGTPDATKFLRGDRAWVGFPQRFGFPVPSPVVANYDMGWVMLTGVASRLTILVTGGTSVTLNVQDATTSTNLLTSAVTVAASSTPTVVTTINNPNLAAGDHLILVVSAVTGAVSSLVFQLQAN